MKPPGVYWENLVMMTICNFVEISFAQCKYCLYNFTTHQHITAVQRISATYWYHDVDTLGHITIPRLTQCLVDSWFLVSFVMPYAQIRNDRTEWEHTIGTKAAQSVMEAISDRTVIVTRHVKLSCRSKHQPTQLMSRRKVHSMTYCKTSLTVFFNIVWNRDVHGDGVFVPSPQTSHPSYLSP